MDATLQAGRSRVDAPFAIRLWLFAVAGLVVAMVIVGGATRLTESGLSITEWKPVLGALPPLGEAQWLAEFEKYKEIPQYRMVNRGMSLDEFKVIYWWEWGHRLLGRLIGLAFVIPFLAFWITGKIDRVLAPRLAALLALGAAQGVLGWYMVMSGLVDRVSVSQYRLAAHLTLAVVILAAVLWVALGIGWGAFIAADWAFACTLMPKQHAGTYMGVWDVTTLLPQVLAPIGGETLPG